MGESRPLAAVFTPCTFATLRNVWAALPGCNDLVLEVDPDASAVLILAPPLALPVRATSGDELRERAAGFPIVTDPSLPEDVVVVVEADTGPSVDSLERAAAAAAPAPKAKAKKRSAPKVTRVCPGCDQEFQTPEWSARESCSEKCRQRIKQRAAAEKKATVGIEVHRCDDCDGRPFTTKRGLSKHRTAQHPIAAPKVRDVDAARARAAEAMA